MNPNELLIRFETVERQSEGPVTRLVGFVRARNLLPLLDAADLEANPRTAKIGPITTDIIESIENTPALFPFKTKGILIASANCRELERRRWHMTFENPNIEGILDGGHNTLAIGTHILAIAHGGGTKAVKKIKAWPDFKEAWTEGKEAVAALKASTKSGDGGPLDFLVPVEVLIPSDPEDQIVRDDFTSSLFEICAARNNNRQLADEAKANKKGFYDELRKHVPGEIAKRIEWKPNDGGEVKVRDVVTLTWVPLSVLKLPDGVVAPRPADIYSGKGKCSSAFDSLMENETVSTKTTDGRHELHNTAINGALAIGGEFLKLVDRIYTQFPLAYNRTGGRFGSLRAVISAEALRTKPVAPFSRQPVDYKYPDGFIVPLIYGLKALLEVDTGGRLKWKINPNEFLDKHFDEVVRKYKVLIQAFGGDPQKIGKSEGSYSLAYDAFETELLKLQQVA